MKEENLKRKLFKNFLPYKIHVGSLEKNLNFATKPFLQEIVDNCCVFDLTHIYVSLNRVKQYIFRLHEHQKKILFVGSSKSLKKEFSELCTNYKHYFIDTWFDGLFTNLNPVYQKKRKTLLHVTERPSLIFLFDLAQYEEVKKEALRLEIPIMAFINSNDNIENIDYPIPGNIKSLSGAIFVFNFFCEIFQEAEEAKNERIKELERRKKALEETRKRRRLLRLRRFKKLERQRRRSKMIVFGKKERVFSSQDFQNLKKRPGEKKSVPRTVEKKVSFNSSFFKQKEKNNKQDVRQVQKSFTFTSNSFKNKEKKKQQQEGTKKKSNSFRDVSISQQKEKKEKQLSQNKKKSVLISSFLNPKKVQSQQVLKKNKKK